MNIFWHEFREYRRSAIGWAIAMISLASLYIVLFKGLGREIESFKMFLTNMPDVLKQSFNILVDSISTLEGFYSIIFSFVLLCGAIQAMNIGTAIVSKEMRDHTVDFLMTKPVSRFRILTFKLLAAFVVLILTNVVYQAATIFVAVSVVESFRLQVFVMISCTLFFVQVVFLAIGVFVSVIARKIHSVISVSLSVVFGLYVVGSLGTILGEDVVRYFSPFRYFDATYIIKQTAYETRFVVVAISVIVFLLVSSYFIYRKKDLHTV